MQPWQTRSADFHPYMIDALAALPAALRSAAELVIGGAERDLVIERLTRLASALTDG